MDDIAIGPFDNRVWGLAGSLAFVAAIIAVLLYFDLEQEVVSLLEWIDAQGAWAPLLFVALMTFVVVFLLPGAFFTLGAGFVFGVGPGSLYVLAGTTLGAAIAFLAARWLLGERAARFVRERSRLEPLRNELERSGWRAVLLVRLVPFFPSKLANYCFGLTRLSLKEFVGGSLIGFIPFTVHNVYLGSLAADLAGAASGERPPSQWALYGAGFLVTVAAVIYFGHLARRALAVRQDCGDGRP